MAATLGTLNPFRYRGYVYDEETGLYYLWSRYYNPVWGRFVNGDSVLGKPGQLLGHNVFAYCKNSPIAMYDSNGHASQWVHGLLQQPELSNAFQNLPFTVVGMHWPPFTYTKSALSRIERNMTYIEASSAETGTPVPMIEAVLFREVICYGVEDALTDWCRIDASQGIAQIKPSTAQRAYEYFNSGQHFPLKAYHGMLQYDSVNIYFCALVLKYEAANLGYDITSLSETQLQEVFSAYNTGKPTNINSAYVTATMLY